MNRTPSPSALRTFEAAARLGSFKEAATELHVTPTAVSHQIRALEEQLGLALFVRRTRQVMLTENGERLAEAVIQAFRHISSAIEEISITNKTITVTTTPAFATLWLVPRLGRFQEAYPEYRLQLDTGTEPMNLHRDRQVDVAIRYGLGNNAGLKEQFLVSEYFAAYGAPDYISSLTDLRKVTFFETAWKQPLHRLWKDNGLNEITWSSWFSRAGLDIRPTAERLRRFNQEHHLIQAGIAGQGLILASSVLVEDTVARGLLAPYHPKIALEGMHYHALCLGARASEPKIKHFLQWLNEEFQ